MNITPEFVEETYLAHSSALTTLHEAREHLAQAAMQIKGENRDLYNAALAAFESAQLQADITGLAVEQLRLVVRLSELEAQTAAVLNARPRLEL